MAIIETPLRYNRLTGQTLIKSQPHSWVDYITDFATGLIQGLQKDESVSETSLTVMAEQEAFQQRERDKKLFFYGGIALLAVVALRKR